MVALDFNEFSKCDIRGTMFQIPKDGGTEIQLGHFFILGQAHPLVVVGELFTQLYSDDPRIGVHFPTELPARAQDASALKTMLDIYYPTILGTIFPSLWRKLGIEIDEVYLIRLSIWKDGATTLRDDKIFVINGAITVKQSDAVFRLGLDDTNPFPGTIAWVRAHDNYVGNTPLQQAAFMFAAHEQRRYETIQDALFAIAVGS